MNVQNTSSLDRFAPFVTRNLIFINVIVWLAQIVLLRSQDIDLLEVFGLHYYEATGFRLWQSVSYMFLHDSSGVSHLLFNMLSFYFFAPHLERVFGSKRFLLYYLVCGLSAGLLQELIWFYELAPLSAKFGAFAPVYYNSAITIGASGAVFGVMLAFAFVFPNARMSFLFIPYPIKAPVFILIMACFELFLGVYATGSNVAHFAHLGGMIGGLVLLLLWRRVNR